jgi:hypothetical protein
MPTRIFNLEYVRAIIGVVLVLAAVEVFARTDFFYELAPDSEAQEPIELVELGFSLIPDPKLIVLGNSLTRNAIASFEPTRLAAADRHFLLNLSQSGGVMSDQLWLYERYREKFQRADTLVIGIDFRSFDHENRQEIGSTSRFRRYASLTQRLLVNDRSEKISLVAGSIWKTWDGRQQLRGYINDVAHFRIGRYSKPQIDELGRFAIKGPITPTEVNRIVAYAPKNYAFARGVQFEAFTKLVRLAREDSLRIVLLEAPATDVYLDQLERNNGSEIRKLYDEIEKVAGTSIIQISPTEDDCPRIEDCYIDYGHMNANGSKIYTRLFLERLSILSPSAKPESP